ncbi:MAG: hypothetical protein R2823_03185 [Acidimicrobiia bacterium]
MTQPGIPLAAAPGSGPAAVPPQWIPLGFMLAAGVGFTGVGFSTWFGADKWVLSPFHSAVVSTAHLAMLAFLTTAVLGALHQFGPVVGQRPLRSIPVAVATMIGMILTGWLLPMGFAHGPEWLVATGATIGVTTVILAAWNLSGPLLSRVGGVPVVGLRISVLYLLVTVSFGIVYAFNREGGWFPLLPTKILAHAHLGLLGWLGLTYISVAEKLWPMFLLAHRPSNRSGAVAVAGVAIGTLPLALGLLYANPVAAWIGAVFVVVGLAAHLISLAASVRHRRRKLELLHAFLFASTAFLIAGVALGGIAGFGGVDAPLRLRIAVAEIVAIASWLGLAIVGHAHKIVPFITYSMLRARGIRNHVSGRPLLFSDLYNKRVAWVVLFGCAIGFTGVLVGTLIDSSSVVAVAGMLIAATAATVTTNFIVGTRSAPVSPPDPSSIDHTTIPVKGTA